MKVRISAQTNRGLHRDLNEDAFAVCQNLKTQTWLTDKISDHSEFINLDDFGVVAIVADGMGGCNAGEIASKLVVDELKAQFNNSDLKVILSSSDKIQSLLINVLSQVNALVLKYSECHQESIGMGSTVVVLWLVDQKAHVVWCGDSRCYVFNVKHGLRQLTKDHTVAQEKIESNLVIRDEDYHMLTKYMGAANIYFECEYVQHEIMRNDHFILCSDGLCGYCDDKDIEYTLYNGYPYKQHDICNDLMKDALNAGGYDNITIVSIATLHGDRSQLPYTLKDKYTCLLKGRHRF